MPEFEEITQSLLAPELDIFGIEREPMYIGQYMLTNRLVNAVAHLAAVDGKKSRLLSCDNTGQLAVSDATTHTYLSNPLSIHILDHDGTDGAAVDAYHNLQVELHFESATVYATTNGPGAEGHYGLVVWDYNAYRLFEDIDDCYDSVNHAIRTIAV